MIYTFNSYRYFNKALPLLILSEAAAPILSRVTSESSQKGKEHLSVRLVLCLSGVIKALPLLIFPVITRRGESKLFQKLKSDYISWIVLIGAFFLLLDVFFFNRGLIFSLIVATGMVYLGRKRMPRKTGKLLFWVGLFFLVVNVLNMLAIKFFLLAIICILIVQYANRKKQAKTILPIIKEQVDLEKRSETVVKEQPLFQNRLFGQQKLLITSTNGMM